MKDVKSNNSTVSRSYDCTKAKGKNVETPKGGVFFFFVAKGISFH